MMSHISLSLLNLRSTRPGAAFARRLVHRFRAFAQPNLFAVALLMSLIGVPAHAAGGAPALLGPASASDVALFGQNAQLPDAAVVRHMPVAVNFQNLNPQTGSPPKQISADIFDGRSITLNLDRIEKRNLGNYTWHGKIQGYPKGYAILSVVNGEIAGTIELGEVGKGLAAKYQIQSRGDGLTVLRQIDQDTFPPDHPPGAEDPQAPTATTKAAFGPSGGSADLSATLTTMATMDAGSTIDVMVVYSNQAAAAAGLAIGAQIQHAVDTANTVYANSGITPRLRLVYYGQVNHNESGDFPTDLNWLDSDVGIAALRNSYGADLVSMFVEMTQYCGYGWIGPSANYAFTVVNRGCSSGNYSFPHEIGHNFGSRHDAYVDSSTTPYAYGHGYVDCVEGWRDVMAYPSQCGGTRIPYFSNPNMMYGSPPDPLGTTSTADNVRVHNQNAVTVANFRLTTMGGGCSYALSPTNASFGAGAGSGSFGVTAGAGCAWNTAVTASWLTIGAGSGTAASGTLNYSVAANGGSARTGTITIGGQAFTVSQASGCSFSLNPTNASFAAAGGSGTTTLTAAGCTWTASSSASWLTVSSASSGTGTATIAYVAGVNTGAARSANLTIGGVTFVVTQGAGATSSAAAATLSASQIQFGNQQVNKTARAKSVTLTNSGGGTLTIASLTSGGANSTDFMRSGTCAVNIALAAGQSCTLQYTFSPTAAGARSATLVAGTNAGNATLSLTGTGTISHGR